MSHTQLRMDKVCWLLPRLEAIQITLGLNHCQVCLGQRNFPTCWAAIYTRLQDGAHVKMFAFRYFYRNPDQTHPLTWLDVDQTLQLSSDGVN